MNVIILTGKFGMGHIKAAQAIKEEIEAKDRDANVNIVDFFEYIFPKSASTIYGGFNILVTKCSGLYNCLNKVAGKQGGVPLKHTLCKKIKNLLDDYEADVVIAALPICSQYISAYKEISRRKILLCTYITDITAHEEWVADNTDFYFVGDRSTKEDMVERGIEGEKIIISGIPVRKAFKQTEKKSISKRDLNGTKRKVLVMGGGLGLLPEWKEMLLSLESIADTEVILITGSNEKLRAAASKMFPRIKVIGYTDRVDLYMKEADVIVTKAGGITTFEAIAAKTPLCIVPPFLEQEQGNAMFIKERGLGIVMDSSTDMKPLMERVIKDEELRRTIENNMHDMESTFVSPWSTQGCTLKVIGE